MKKRMMKKHVKNVNRCKFICELCKVPKDYKCCVIDNDRYVCLYCLLKGDNNEK